MEARSEPQMNRQPYKLTDASGEVYDVRWMDSVDLERAQLVMRESTDSARFWKLMTEEQWQAYLDRSLLELIAEM